MPTFQYRAKKGPQEIIEGSLEAPSEKDAVELLSRSGVVPFSLKEVSAGSSRPTGADGASASRRRFSGAVRSRDVTVFSRQLASLLRSGVPILACLTIIADQCENARFSEVLRTVQSRVKEGMPFSDSLKSFPGLFPPLYVAMVHSGENSGVLPEVLLRIAAYRSEQEETLNRLRMAMVYPAFMALVGIATVVFMLTYVMPRLLNIFEGLGQALPLPTRVLIALSKTLSQWWLWAGVVLAAALLSRLFANPKVKSDLSALSLRLPLLGPLILKAQLSLFCRTMELLLKSGIPILRAITVAVPVVNNPVIRGQLQKSHRALEQGGSFGRSLKSTGSIPAFMSNLISVGEESGKLTEALGEIALSYDHDTQEQMKVLSNLMEPAMILLMGGIVGFIVVAMLLPVFEMNLMAR